MSHHRTDTALAMPELPEGMAVTGTLDQLGPTVAITLDMTYEGNGVSIQVSGFLYTMHRENPSEEAIRIITKLALASLIRHVKDSTSTIGMP